MHTLSILFFSDDMPNFPIYYPAIYISYNEIVYIPVETLPRKFRHGLFGILIFCFTTSPFQGKTECMETRTIRAEGHIIDSGILSTILNTILAKGLDYRILVFHVGKTPEEISQLEIEILGSSSRAIDDVIGVLKPYGVFPLTVPSATLVQTEKDACAPQDFYSTSNHKTAVFFEGSWHPVYKQRMDGVLVYLPDSRQFHCRKLRDIKAGDAIVCGNDSVRVFPVEAETQAIERPLSQFAFMTQEVSSERSVTVAVEKLAQELQAIRERKGKTVIVCGPVVVHTGGADALAALVRAGYVQGFLGGNAVAVHDLELRMYGTSLGVNLHTGEVAEHGHSHHMRAINTINTYGSIEQAIDANCLTSGLMYEIIKSGIPYCLAGSIRDDGPLPETVTDMIEAQNQYAQIIEEADLIIMLSTMLHAIGVGNMTPSWVKTVCIDINPAVVTKLTDRGSSQAVGIVSDVGLFLRALAKHLNVSL